MAITTTAATETTFGCDLRARATCTGGADTVVTTRVGLAFSCTECADEHAELAAAVDPDAAEAPF